MIETCFKSQMDIKKVMGGRAENEQPVEEPKMSRSSSTIRLHFYEIICTRAHSLKHALHDHDLFQNTGQLCKKLWVEELKMSSQRKSQK